MTTKTTPPTTRAKTKIKQQQNNREILRTRQQLTLLHKILRGINSEFTYILLQNTYITEAFKIRRGDTNVGVSPRVRNPQKKNST